MIPLLAVLLPLLLATSLMIGSKALATGGPARREARASRRR